MSFVNCNIKVRKVRKRKTRERTVLFFVIVTLVVIIKERQPKPSWSAMEVQMVKGPVQQDCSTSLSRSHGTLQQVCKLGLWL